MYVGDGDEQVVVAADLRRGEPITTCRGSCCFGEWYCRYLHKPMPLEENLSCNKEGDRGPHLPQRDMCGKVMTAVLCKPIPRMLLKADYGGPRWCLLTTRSLSTVAPRCVHPSTRNVEQFVFSSEPRLMKHSFFGSVNQTTASGSFRTDLHDIQQPL